jgi:hypothetical protein
MSIPAAFDLNEWDVRHYSLPAAHSKQSPIDQGVADPQYIESLLETIENADAAAADGWQLARIKLESDDEGRHWLDVWLKRPKSSVPQVPIDVPPTNRAA